MNILITGATGFVGHALLARLGQHDVACLGRNKPTLLPSGVLWIEGSLLELDAEAHKAIKGFAPECCVHLAWTDLPDYSLVKCQDNLRAGLQLFQLLRDIDCRKIICAGSCWEYGERRGPVDESMTGVRVNLFAAHKNSLREIGQSLLQGSNCQLIWARIFFVYGERQRPTSLIPTAFGAIKQGIAPIISTPEATNDFVHVEDVASALQCLVEHSHASGIYNIGSGKPASVAEVVNTIAVKVGLSPLYPLASNHLLNGFWADIHRLGALGWTPYYDLKSGLVQVVRALENID